MSLQPKKCEQVHKIKLFQNGTWIDVKTGTTLAEGVTVGNVTAYGQSLILRNQVNKNSMGDIDFDGGDKIGSSKAISVTRAGWDTKIGTIIGGAVNIILKTSVGHKECAAMSVY